MKKQLTILTVICGAACLAFAQNGKQIGGNPSGQALPPGFPPVNTGNNHSNNPVVNGSMTGGRTNSYQVTNGPGWHYGNTNGGYSGNTNSVFGSNQNTNFNSEFYHGASTNGTGSKTNWTQYTNANGTITFNTNIPHWWKKQ